MASTHRLKATATVQAHLGSYLKSKADELRGMGYLVSGDNELGNWLRIRPAQQPAAAPRLQASAQCFKQPYPCGINGGRITRLWIASSESVLFEFDGGPCLDELRLSAAGRKLYADVLLVLN